MEEEEDGMEDGNEAEISESEEPTDSGVIVPGWDPHTWSASVYNLFIRVTTLDNPRSNIW